MNKESFDQLKKEATISISNYISSSMEFNAFIGKIGSLDLTDEQHKEFHEFILDIIFGKQ